MNTLLHNNKCPPEQPVQQQLLNCYKRITVPSLFRNCILHRVAGQIVVKLRILVLITDNTTVLHFTNCNNVMWNNRFYHLTVMEYQKSREKCNNIVWTDRNRCADGSILQRHPGLSCAQ